MKWLITLVLIAAIGGAGWWYYKHQHTDGAEYQTVAVARADLTQAVTATGQLGPVLTVQVGSQISGIVKKLFADFNSVVKSNQVIAEIDPSTYQLNVLKAEAGVANSKANMTLAEVQAHRADELFTNRLISASDHDTANAQLLQAKAQVQSDEATLKSAQVQLSYCTIYAPVDGVVISRNVDVGQTVAASFNTPTLYMIANDLTKMQIDAMVSEADIGNVTVGQNVNFSVDAFPYRTFKGKVSQVRYGSITNQNVISYDCVVEVNNSDLKLLPGMTANVSIIIAERNDVLKIPNAALRFRPPEVAATNSAPQLVTQGARGGNESGAAPGGFRQGGPGGAGRPGGAEGTGRGGGPGGFGGGPRGGSGGGGRPRAERQLVRTVYVLPASVDAKNGFKPKPEPKQIKVGISDGISTEVLDGLEEGMQVVTGMISGGDNASRPSGPSNPFGGGPFRRF